MKYGLYQLFIFLNCICVYVLAGEEDADGGQIGILAEEFLNYKAPAYWKGGQLDWFRCADTVQNLDEFEYTVTRNHFTSRYSTILTVPEDGNYRFHIAGNSELRLYVSTTGDELKVDRVAYVHLNSGKRRWNDYHGQASDVFQLKKGQEVAVIALHRQHRNTCNVSVGWSKDDGPIEIIPGKYCRIPWSRWGAHRIGAPVLYSQGESFIVFDWPRHVYGIGIKSFNVFRNGELLAEDVKCYTYTDKTVISGNSYTYTVQAIDHLGRITPQSAPLTVTAQPRNPDKLCESKGTGLRAAYYLPTHERDIPFEGFPGMENHIDGTFFLGNRKATSIIRNDALPSFDYYINNVIYMKDFNRRSVRMEGFLEVPFEGNWKFTAQVSDGIRVWVNRRLVINNFDKKGMFAQARTLRLPGRTKVPIRIECNTGSVQLEWEHLMVPRQIIPREYLYPSPYLESDTLKVISARESYVNPANLEILAGDQVSELECVSRTNKLTVTKLDDQRYYANDESTQTIGVPLEPSLNRPTQVTITYSGAKGKQTVDTSIRWIPVTLNRTNASPSELRIRAGDRLLFCTGETKPTELASVLVKQGQQEDVLSTVDGVLAWDTPGEFQVRAKLADGESDPVKITVYPAKTYPKVIMCLNSSRSWEKPVEIDNLYVESVNDRSFTLFETYPPGKRSFALTSCNLGNSSILVRLAEGKELVTMIPTDTFDVWRTYSERHGRADGKGTLYKDYFILSHNPGPIRAVSICRSMNWICLNGTPIQSFPITESFQNPLIIDIFLRSNIKVGHAWKAVTYYQQDQYLNGIQLAPEP